MSKQLQLGLIVEGNTTNSSILRLPTLVEELGPVKSAALRVARRFSNAIRAGYAVPGYEDLQRARLILIRVPDSAVPRIVQELSEAELVFKDLSFALCESWLTVEALEPLRMRGSSVATLIGVPTLQRNWFIIEGQTTAVRQLSRFLKRNDASASEISEGCKQLYFAAELLAITFPAPLFITAQRALRTAGISGNYLPLLVDQIGQRMFRDVLKGGRTNRTSPLTVCPPDTAQAHLAALRQNNPEIATVVDEQLSLSAHNRAELSET